MVNPIGVSTWVWTSPLTDEDVDRLAPLISGWGFDIIELPIEQPGDWDPARAADLVAAAGLGHDDVRRHDPGTGPDDD